MSTAGPRLSRIFLFPLSSFSLYFPHSSPFSPPGTGPPAASPTKLCNAGSRRCHPTCARPRPRGAPRSRPASPGLGAPFPGWGGAVPASAAGAARGSTGPPGVSTFLPPLRVYLRHFAPEPGHCRVSGVVSPSPALPKPPGRAPPLSRPGCPHCRPLGCRSALFFLFPFLTLIHF